MSIQFHYFKIGFVFVLLLNHMSSLRTFYINLLSDIRFVYNFSHFIGCLFILLVACFSVEELFILMSSHLIFAFFFFLVPYLKIIAKTNVKETFPSVFLVFLWF